ncbi:hypothetical protein CBR_g34585 [Chara braunii]|uniref:Uncharacterized protein n=1 Tax=Chara braunii TaxID=69332 RepID=A0A388LJ71_CHABU|nr:hypothetical protein CBR_g34585 [Chara braunii]|eukprot:GBG82301.1 hypothetical protein CBR_g34585 [Chara braunii]
MEMEEARSVWLAKQLEKEEQQRKARLEELDGKAQRLGIRLKGQGHKLGHGDKKAEEENNGNQLSQERERTAARTGETSSSSRSSTQPAEQRPRPRPPAGGALGGFGNLPTYRPAARRRPGGGG